MNKVDVWTGISEMASICSIPINFIILRGQGIKLMSYIAKKCREKETLIPVIEKSFDQEGFEGGGQRHVLWHGRRAGACKGDLGQAGLLG